MNNVHKKYQDVVLEFQKIFGDGYLAGGAVRDTIFGQPVKDLDLVTTQEVTQDKLKAMWPDREFVKLSGEDNPYDNAELLGVWGTAEGDLTVMQVYSFHNYIDSFPDNISAVWYNGRFVDWRFDWLSVLSEGVVSCKHDIQEKRLEKLKAKYPDMEYVIEENPYDDEEEDEDNW